ncbi:MAG: Xaa-Pro peptidase family protein [Actinomycetota bacterium]
MSDPSPAAPILTPPSGEQLDLAALRRYRLDRFTAEMTAAGVDLAVLTNPVSLRYVADWREYLPYQSHIPTYTLFVDRDGDLTLNGAYGARHEVIDRFGPTHGLNGFDGGLDQAKRVERFVADVTGVVGSGARVALEPLNPSAALALDIAGFDVVDAEPLIERAKYVKSAEELVCIRHSISVAEAALGLMRDVEPGVTENQLFAILHLTNIANDGDWIDGRMLCSGPRTNPWYQQSTDRVVNAGDLVAVDTDMIGPFGYTADISRTWVAGSVTPTDDQRDRYRRAHEEIHHNAALLEPGRTFRELIDKSFRQPEEFVANRYTCLAHGVGMADEYPRIVYPQDWEREGYDGVIEVGAVLTVESFVGSDRGGPGVKLEDMYHITESGPVRLSSFPFEEDLLA